MRLCFLRDLGSVMKIGYVVNVMGKSMRDCQCLYNLWGYPNKQSDVLRPVSYMSEQDQLIFIIGHSRLCIRMTTWIKHYFAVVQCWPLLVVTDLRHKTGQPFSKITSTEKVFQTHKIHPGLRVQTSLLALIKDFLFHTRTPPDGNRWLDRESEGDKTRGEIQRGLWSGALLKPHCTGLAVFKRDGWGDAWMDGWMQGRSKYIQQYEWMCTDLWEGKGKRN